MIISIYSKYDILICPFAPVSLKHRPYLLTGSLAQSSASLTAKSGGREFEPQSGHINSCHWSFNNFYSHSSRFADSRGAAVRVHLVLVDHLGCLSLHRNNVSTLIDRRVMIEILLLQHGTKINQTIYLPHHSWRTVIHLVRLYSLVTTSVRCIVITSSPQYLLCQRGLLLYNLVNDVCCYSSAQQ